MPTRDFSLPLLLKRCGRLVDQRIEELLKHHRIPRTQYRVLVHVARHNDPTQTQLMQMLEIQGSTLVAIIDACVDKGWLVRTADQADRRTKRLSLTEPGRTLLGQIPDPLDAVTAELARQLSPDEVTAFISMLQRSAQALRKHEPI